MTYHETWKKQAAQKRWRRSARREGLDPVAVQRLKKLGLSLAEVKELNAVYAIGGSTRDMLGRLEELLDGHRAELDARIDELIALRSEIGRYRDHVDHRLRDLDGGGRSKKAAPRSARGR